MTRSSVVIRDARKNRDARGDSAVAAAHRVALRQRDFPGRRRVWSSPLRAVQRGTSTAQTQPLSRNHRSTAAREFLARSARFIESMLARLPEGAS